MTKTFNIVISVFTHYKRKSRLSKTLYKTTWHLSNYTSAFTGTAWITLKVGCASRGINKQVQVHGPWLNSMAETVAVYQSRPGTSWPSQHSGCSCSTEVILAAAPAAPLLTRPKFRGSLIAFSCKETSHSCLIMRRLFIHACFLFLILPASIHLACFMPFTLDFQLEWGGNG